MPLSKRLTEAVVEDAALRGLTTNELAAAVGVGGKYPGKQVESVIYSSKYPELKRAWKTGKARRAAESKPLPGENPNAGVIVVRQKPAPKMPIELPSGGDSGENLTSELASEMAVKPVKDDLPRGFMVDERDGENDADLWQTDDDPQLEENLELVSPSNRREKLDEIQNKLMPPPPLTISGGVEILGRLMTRHPAGLQIGFEGDFFKLSEKQRSLLCEMAHLNDEFQKENR